MNFGTAEGAGLCLALVLLCATQAHAFYLSSGPVTELTPSNFESKIKSGGVWLIEFYAPWCGHCKNLKPAWEQAAGALKGIVNVAAVDCDAHQSLAQQYGVQGFPTIKLFYAEGASVKNVDYRGGRSASDIISWGVDQAKSIALKRIGARSSGSSSSSAGGGGKCGGASASAGAAGSCGGGGSTGGSTGGFYGANSAVVSLGEDNFESEVLDSGDLWMVEFYAPWCGHCKNLKPAWEEAAKELRGSAKVGAVDCTVHQGVCGRYGVQGYPTIKVFGQDKHSPQDYQGGRDSGSIAEFARQAALTLAPPPEARELTSQSVFNEHCLKASPAKAICFIAFLPNLLDSKAAGRNKYIDILQKTAEAYKDRPRYAYFWLEAGAQPELEANVDVGGFGYPALVAYFTEQKQYLTGMTAYELDHVKEWVGGLSGRRLATKPVVGELAKLRTVPSWDGSDAVEAMEEEFNLDDIMNEEL